MKIRLMGSPDLARAWAAGLEAQRVAAAEQHAAMRERTRLDAIAALARILAERPIRRPVASEISTRQIRQQKRM